MATRSFELTDDWQEVTASSALNMVDDTNYVVEIQGNEGSKVLAHDEAANTKPAANAGGHTYFPASVIRDATYRIYPKKSGQYWWMKTVGLSVNADAIKVVVTEIQS